MNANEPLVTSLEAVKVWREQRFNPIRSVTPASLARALEAFEIGEMREAALLFETIAERDDTLMSVKPKREKAVSQLDRQVTVTAGSGAAGEAHKEVLEDFWNNVQAVSAYDRNARGRFRRLVKQMMTAVSFRYAAHHIVWQVKNGKLRATFEFVPLWLFENRTGTLKYLKDPWQQNGEILADGEWMVTAGDGLMIACSIGWSAKRNAFNDWLIFSARFSVPGTLGRTSAAADSPEGRAMRDAVATFGHDWKGVIYEDDGTHGEPITVIQAQGNPSGMPMPAVVERVDRKFAALYRGADLSTMSAGGGEGTGASLQEKEGDILLADDAETISETLEEISKKVIEWHFGYGVEPLARVELIVPRREDARTLVTDAGALADRGGRVSVSALMDRLSLQTAQDDSDVLGAIKSQDGKTQDAREEKRGAGTSNIERPTSKVEGKRNEEVANAEVVDGMRELRKALTADLKPLGDALASALAMEDFGAMQGALRKISAKMPELAGDAAGLAEVMAEKFGAAFFGTEEVANGDFVGHPFRGNQHSRKGTSREGSDAGWKDALGPLPMKGKFLNPLENETRMRAALSRCATLKRDVPKAAFREGLGQVDLPYGRPGNPAVSYADGYGASHIEAKHGRAALQRLPEILARGEIHPHDREAHKRFVTLGADLVVMGRKDARHSWVITSFEDKKTTNKIQGR